MSVQITVRIPDDLAAWIDEKVSSGAAASRAAAMSAAIAAAVRREREQRLIAQEWEQVQASYAADPRREPWEPGADPDEARAYREWEDRNLAEAWGDLD